MPSTRTISLPPQALAHAAMPPEHGIDPFRASMYRVVFTLAGVYNLAFGAWAGFAPLSFFRLFRMEAPRYPALWACLGMVVGVYGLLYLYAARRLDRAAPIIAVGLLGKVLGPAGLVVSAAGGELPVRMLSLLVLNDLVWWLPFGLFLLEGTRVGERVRGWAPSVCAAVHAAAVVAVLVLRPGTEAVPDPALRAEYLRAHTWAWRAGWAVWMAAALSVTGFYAWWGARVPSRRTGMLAALTCGVGMTCDLTSEAVYTAWLPWLANGMLTGVSGAAADFVEIQRNATLLTAGVANGLYTLAGAMLTVATPSLSRGEKVLAWVAWAAGAGLSVAAVLGSAPAMVGVSAVLFPAFVVLTLLVWKRLR